MIVQLHGQEGGELLCTAAKKSDTCIVSPVVGIELSRISGEQNVWRAEYLKKLPAPFSTILSRFTSW